MRPALALLLLISVAPCGCGKKPAPRKSADPEPAIECMAAEDCKRDDPCTEVDCVNDRCVATPVARGQTCDGGTFCSGAAQCDGKGRCVAGAPLRVDDGNACTVDACDPLRGVTHQPVSIDDGDGCTTDACDPRTGAVTHDPVDLDDGDDCTFDTCNPQTGVSHQRPDPKATCDASCGAGYHAASRSPNGACGEAELRSFCVADCGKSFYTCDSACPTGYRKISETASRQCGPVSPMLSFCVKD